MTTVGIAPETAAPVARRRFGFWRSVLLALLAAGLVFGALRWTSGLGAVTNLSDKYPWGVWKALNVLAGVALGGAGFTVMALVYVFHVKALKPIVRPVVLMAFLAYSSAAFSLFIDIGKSWAIWHPIVMWNKQSILFDVAWCLMLYTTVLVLEGSGMLFERLGWNRMVKIQHAATVPVVIVGVLLSTMHQSSLGGLFVIVPGKLHPFWYSPMLPLLFFSSAIATGLAMVIVLSRMVARGIGAVVQPSALLEVGRILLAAIGFYGVLRIWDLADRGVLSALAVPSNESLLFAVEFLVGVVLPFAVLAVPSFRQHPRTLEAASTLVVLGMVANRLNVGITGFEAAQGGNYVPSAPEFLISLAVVGLAFAAFRFGAGYLRVFAAPHASHS